MVTDLNFTEDINVLLLPVKHKYGSLIKVEELTKELTYENKDWKYIINGLRSYLYDHLYDLVPYSDQVLTVIFYYIKEATNRKRNSAIRACDTFFDRYIFILQKLKLGDERFQPIKIDFNDFLDEYIDLLTEKSKEGFYFDSSIDKIIAFGSILAPVGNDYKNIIKKLANFLLSQYKLYVKRSILIHRHEIDEIKEILPEKKRDFEFIKLFEEVSDNSYIKKIERLEEYSTNNPEKFFEAPILT